MIRFTLAPALLLALSLTSAAFDFTPREVIIPSSGGGAPDVIQYLQGDHNAYRFFLYDATLAGNSEQATFTFPSIGNATATLRNCPLTAKREASLSDFKQEQIVKAAQSFGPSGAHVTSSSVGKFQLDPREEAMISVETTYAVGGQEIRQQVVFGNILPETPTVLIITAYGEEIARATALAQRILNSLSATTADALKTPTTM